MFLVLFWRSPGAVDDDDIFGESSVEAPGEIDPEHPPSKKLKLAGGAGVPGGGAGKKKYPNKASNDRRKVKNRTKMTRGQDQRHRLGPEIKREHLQALSEWRAHHKNFKWAKKDGLPIIEWVAKDRKIPLSNLRAWEKNATRILKLAGQIEASKIMGVKQRRLANKVGMTRPSGGFRV